MGNCIGIVRAYIRRVVCYRVSSGGFRLCIDLLDQRPSLRRMACRMQFYSYAVDWQACLYSAEKDKEERRLGGGS